MQAEKALQREKMKRDEAAKQEYDTREEQMRQQDDFFFATKGVNEACHCTTCRMPFDPKAEGRRVCSVVQPTGLTCDHAGPFSEVSCGCDVTQCVDCEEWVCRNCTDLHFEMDQVRCGPYEHKHACHKLPVGAYNPNWKENSEDMFEVPADWKRFDDYEMALCPDCAKRFRKVNKCYCSVGGMRFCRDCIFSNSPKYPQAVEEAEQIRQQLKQDLPDFKTQQLLCYGNVVAKARENVIANALQMDSGGIEESAKDVLNACERIEKDVLK